MPLHIQSPGLLTSDSGNIQNVFFLYILFSILFIQKILLTELIIIGSTFVGPGEYA